MFLLPTSHFFDFGWWCGCRRDDVACYKDTQPECKSSNNYECVTAT